VVRLALSASVAVGLRRREPCRKSILVGRRWPATAEQDVPSRGQSVARLRDAQKETVLRTETGDKLFFNLLGSRRLSTTTQPRIADFSVSYLSFTASASMQTRSTFVFVAMTAEQCCSSLAMALTVDHLVAVSARNA
jgi:hypothetical protein